MAQERSNQPELGSTYAALNSLLHAVAQTFDAREACIVSPTGAAECFTFASASYAEQPREMPFEVGVRDVESGIEGDSGPLARLVVVDPALPVPAGRLEAFATAAGHIMKQAALLADAAGLLEETRTLREISLQLGERDELEQLLLSVTQHARRLLNTDYAAIAIARSDGSTRWVVGDGVRTDMLRTTIFPPGEGTAGRVLQTRGPVILDGIGSESDLPAGEFPVHTAEGGVSALGVPLLRGGQPFGALILGSRRPRKWRREEVELASVLASSAGVVSAQARTAAEVKTQSAFLSKVIEQFPGILVVMEAPPDFRVRALNSRMAALLPEPFNSLEAAIGRPVRDLSSNAGGGTDAALDEMMRRVYETGEPVTFEQYESNNPATGTAYWNWSIVPVEGDDQSGGRLLMLIAVDITESVLARKRAQVSARDARARADELETVINQMADGVAIFDENGTATRINPAGTRLLGEGMLRGSATSLVEAAAQSVYRPNAAPFDHDQLPYRRALRGETVVGEQLLIRRAGGSEAILSVSAAPLVDNEGNGAGAVAVFRDITQEKMVERMKDEFLSVVSHELRTPLSAIMGYSDLMLRGVHGSLNDRQARALKAVRANADRLLHLINDLLDVSKLESGTVPVNLAPVDLGDLIGRTIAQMRVLASEAQLTVMNNVNRAGVVRAFADEPKLQQVIENLLANAIKFTPPGGSISFDCAFSEREADDPRLAMREERGVTDHIPAARSVILSVRDTGTGLEGDQLERIWDRFYQVDTTAKRRSGGAGLGLAIVRGVLDLQGGQVWAESEGRDKGSTFSFSLPLATVAQEERDALEREEAAESAAARRAQPSNQRAGVVLVVEDDADQREIICDMLEMEGYEVALATDGEQAMKMVPEVRPSAVALDVLLPRNDGWEVLHFLKNNPKTANIPVLIISVVDQQEFGRKLGADEYLLKPIEPMALRETIRRMLRGRESKIGAEQQT